MKNFGTAIILAGGKSTRMGFDKQFLEINKGRIMDTIIAKLEMEFEEIIIISNKPGAYKGYPQKVFTDKIKDMGPLGGIYTGLRESKSKYAFIIACDMPNISLEYIHYMKGILEKYSPDICITKIEGNLEPFHGFYSKDIVEDIEGYLLMGKRDIRGLTKELNTYYIQEYYAREYSSNLSIFKNLNTQEDLKGVEMLTQISIEEAKNILSQQQFKLKTVDIPILDSLGCVLGEDIISDINMPPFDRSALDGYAFKSKDIVDANRKKAIALKVTDFIPAGYISSKKIEGGQAARIMTGAKIPQGADTVIGHESTDFTEEEVKIYDYFKPNSNIIKEGEDIKVGDRILEKGHIIEPADIGILAILGREKVKVFSKPKVAIMATGNELVNIGETPQGGQIRNSNSYTIAAQVKRLGGDPIVMEICKDEIENISENLINALEWSDMVITTGGVSVGDKDVVKDGFETLGAEILFWKVNMRPGGPIAVAKYKDKLIFGLPGNPGAAYITFEIFTRPVILRLMGIENTNLLKVRSTLEGDFNKVRKQDRYLSVMTYYKNGEFYTRVYNSHSSGAMSNLSKTNSLLLIPAGTGPYSTGDKIEVELLEGLEAIK